MICREPSGVLRCQQPVMLRRLLTTWAFLGLSALTATAVGLLPQESRPVALSHAPAPLRAVPSDISTAGLLEAESVSLSTLLEALQPELDAATESEEVQADFRRLTQAHGLTPSETLLSDYLKVKLAFEATRDAGWWYLRWDITDREPRSDAIWTRWASWSGGPPLSGSGIAECDELSALFAFLAQRMGVEGVGLFWPTTNHTVAVWSPAPQTRLVVPTTQLFLSPLARLGTAEMDPFTQRTIHPYTRQDVPDDFTISGHLATFFHLQVRRYLSTSELTLQHMRNLRAEALQQHWGIDEVHASIDGLQQNLRADSASQGDLAAVERLRLELTSPHATNRR